MKDKDRVWIAVYLDVDDFPEPTKSEYLDNVAFHLNRGNDGTIKYMVFPSDENKVQLIYDPKGYRNKNNRENLRLAKEYLKKLTEKENE